MFYPLVGLSSFTIVVLFTQCAIAYPAIRLPCISLLLIVLVAILVAGIPIVTRSLSGHRYYGRGMGWLAIAPIIPFLIGYFAAIFVGFVVGG